MALAWKAGWVNSPRGFESRILRQLKSVSTPAGAARGCAGRPDATSPVSYAVITAWVWSRTRPCRSATLRAGAGTGLYLCLVALLSLGVALIVRNTGAALVVGGLLLEVRDA